MERLRFVGVMAATLAVAATGFGQSPVLTKFVGPLRGVGPGGIPVAVPDGTRTYKTNQTGLVTADHYTIDINQFTDTLHPELPPTTLWGYNPRKALGEKSVPTPRHLGGIIVVQRGKAAQITFRNNLPTEHILPVDTTLMCADGAQNRTSVHLHGGLVPWTSDGGPFSWWDPQGNKGPTFLNNQTLRPKEKVPSNEAEYYYPNNQSARMEWYHDHAIGITRLNAYAGIASGYIIRDDFESSMLVTRLGLPAFVENGGRELPIVIQDKIFLNKDDASYPGSKKTKGSLWYPYVYDPAKWELQGGTPPPVSVVPEMFGDTMLVNGTAYPKAAVDPRRYRLRILNACQARFLNLQLYEDNGKGKPDFSKPGPDFLVIGTEGGFLARPVAICSGVRMKVIVDPVTHDRSVDPTDPGGTLITAPAERWDVVVNFQGKGGKKYILYNDAPAPFPGGSADNDYPNQAGIGDTQVLMRFEVKPDSRSIPADPNFLITPFTPLAGNPLSGIDTPLAGLMPAAPEAALSWLTTPVSPLPIPTRPCVGVRQLTLNEGFDTYGRLIQMLGTNVAPVLGDFSRPYADGMDPVDPMGPGAPTETPKNGAVEVWQIVNLTMDTHPIHFHLANAQLLSRRPFDSARYLLTPAGTKAMPVYTGPARGPDPLELGWKETVKTHPGEVTTFIMKFDLPKVPYQVPLSPRTGGHEYVWHCHILDHEEHDMMRPLVVLP